MKTRKQVVATFNDLEKAQAVKLNLDQAGIPASLVDERKMQRYIYLSKPQACDKVMVEEGNFEKARHFLEEADTNDGILHGEVRCLKCGSPNIEYPQFTRKFVTTTFFGVIFALLHVIDRNFYCADCHHTWPTSAPLRPRNDILGWPVHNRGLVKEERGG